MTDEVYEHLTFGAPHTPIATLPGARERTISISSGGKTFSTTGWKIGWLTAPAALVTSVLAVKQYLTFVNGAPFQPAIATGLGLPDAVFTDAAASPRATSATCSPPASRPPASPSRCPTPATSSSRMPLRSGTTTAPCSAGELPELAGVVGVPVSAFVHPDRQDAYRSLVRFAFCKRHEVLEEASARLARLSAG